MHWLRKWRVGLLLASVILTAAPAPAVNVKFEFDEFGTLGLSSPFFNSGSTEANQAKATLNAAAAYYSNILTDTLDAIIAPTYVSPRVNIAWNWTMRFKNPNGSGELTLLNQAIPADEIRIFAGAQTLSGATLAQAAFGGVQSWGRPGIPPAANSVDINEILARDASFANALTTRGEASGFETWGGSISFDNDTPWHYLHTTPPAAGKIDLFSVALHEIGHVLGFGGALEFIALVKPAGFDGTTSKSVYGGPVPMYTDPLDPSKKEHWAEGVNSTVYGGSASQSAIMVPTLPLATRREVTALDAAALTDIGWSVVSPPTPPGDYNRNGRVDAADYVLWRNTLGQSVATGSGADGSGNSSVGNEDYTYWRARFGNVSASAAGTSLDGSGVTIPEPAGILLGTGVGAIAWLARRKRRR